MYGKAIKEQRKIRQLTQIDVSKATKIPQNSISAWEKDKFEPSIVNCVLLADFYDISLDELIGRDRHYSENGDSYNVNNSGNIIGSFNKK